MSTYEKNLPYTIPKPFQKSKLFFPNLHDCFTNPPDYNKMQFIVLFMYLCTIVYGRNKTVCKSKIRLTQQDKFYKHLKDTAYDRDSPPPNTPIEAQVFLDIYSIREIDKRDFTFRTKVGLWVTWHDAWTQILYQ